jgi:hypothetical protein
MKMGMRHPRHSVHAGDCRRQNGTGTSAHQIDGAGGRSGSAPRVLRFAFLTEKLSIDTGELADKGVISQRNILRRHPALIEKLYADNPADHIICLDRVSERI